MAGQTQAGNRPLSGPEKAAIALLSLEEKTASEILRRMDIEDLQQLTNYVARLREVPPEMVETVKSEFYEQLMRSQGIAQNQGREIIRSLLEKTLPQDKVNKIVEQMETSLQNEGIEALKWLDSQSVATFLRYEHPQTIAIVLAHMEAGTAAEVLSMIPEMLRADVCIRLATLERISPSILSEINNVIRKEMLSQGTSKGELAGGLETVAEIFNHLDKEDKQQVFNAIEEIDPQLSDNIRDLMFVFEDLLSLDNRGMQNVMKEVSNETLTLALKTASPEMMDKMLGNVSQRAAQMIREEMEVMGPVRVTEVEAAQQEILAVARRLEEEGKIVLAGRGGGDILV